MMFKRIFDFSASLIGLLLLWPFGLFAVTIIILTDFHSPFYVQDRIGRHGRKFKCIKFRTMVKGAEKEGSITAAADARITSFGSFLRRFKLDELPQLLNVFIGRMSFVGPRPDVPGYADRLEGDSGKILDLRPGITGPASLYFRNEEGLLAKAGDPKKYNDEIIWPKKVKLNMAYIENWSFWKDIGYILITIIPGLNKVLKLAGESPRKPEEVVIP